MSSYMLHRKTSSTSQQGGPCNRTLEAKIQDIATLRRMHSLKMIELSQEDLGKVDYYQKILKVLKKETKDKKMVDAETNILFQGLYEDIEDLTRDCIWKFRATHTDFEALFLMLKINEKNGGNSQILQEIIKMHERKPQQLLLNCNINVLSEQKNTIQSFTVNTLCDKAAQLLNNTPFMNSLSGQVSTKAVPNLVTHIAKGYNIVPYHNFSHGFGVFLSFYNLNLQIEGLRGLLTDLQLFFACVACLSHDIQHAGNNTLFEVKIESELAVNYGHFSVMEKMHLAKTMEILDRNTNTNQIFMALTPEDRNKARKIVAKAILATDMSQHYILLDQIKQKTLSSDNEEDRALVIQSITHACDIQNPTLEHESYLSWAQLVCIEFHDQTVKEELWNVEVTEFLKFDSLPYFYKNQLSFASSIVLPLWKSLSCWFPEIQEKGYPNQIKKNIAMLTEAMRRNSQNLSRRPMEKYLNFQLAN